MKKTLSIVATLALAIGMTGCKAANSPTPPTASTAYQKSATFMLDFSADLLSAQKTEINLHTGGMIDSATHKKIQAAFAQIDTYGPQIDALIAAQASSATIQAKVNAALDSLNSIINSIGQIDPTTRAQITTAVQLVESVLNNVLAQLKTVASTEVDFGPEYHRSVSRAGISDSLADLQPDQVRGSRFSPAAC